MTAFHLLAYLAIGYYVLLYLSLSVHLLAGYKAALRWKKIGYLEEAHRLSRSDLVPPITIVADLESLGDEAELWVDHVLAQRFPELEVILLFDRLEEARRLVEIFYLRRVDRVYRRVLDAPKPSYVLQSDDRRLVLAGRDGAPRGDSLNMALNMARYPLVAVIGEEVRLEEDALLCMVRPFMEEEVLAPAVMGVELPLSMEADDVLPPRRITRFSLMESLRIQLGFLAGAPYLGGPAVAYGAVTVYRRDDLLSAGGFRPGMQHPSAEMDMILRLHRLMREDGRAYRFVFLPQLVARSAFPQTWGEHVRDSRGRYRGISEALWSERDMLFRARYGGLGMVQLPVFWLFANLAAVVGFACYCMVVLFFILGEIGWPLLAAFLAVSTVFPALVGAGAVVAARRELGILRGQGVLLYAYALLTQLWFRQTTNLANLFDPGAIRRRGG